MGLFDMVWVDCPHCGKPIEFQSKALEDPYMRRFTLENAPVEIVCEIINGPEYCESCGGWMALIDPNFPPGAPRPRPNLKAVKVKTPADAEIHSSQPSISMVAGGPPFHLQRLGKI